MLVAKAALYVWPAVLDDWWYQEVNPGAMLSKSPLNSSLFWHPHPPPRQMQLPLTLVATPVADPKLFPGDLAGFWEEVGLPLDVYSVHYTSTFPLFNLTNGSRLPSVHDDWAPPGGYLPGPDVASSRAFYEGLFDVWGAARGQLRMHEIDCMYHWVLNTRCLRRMPH